MEIITSLANPLVRQARALSQHKARVDSELFLVEGIQPVGAAVAAGWDVEAILYAPDRLTSEFANDLLERAARLPIRLQPVSVKVMESLAEKDNPQGILAIVRQRRTGFDALRGLQSMAALVSPQDPGNVGTILRTLDAVDAGALALLEGGVDLYHPTVVRASMGALFWKPVIRSTFQAFVDWAHGGEIQLIGASARGLASYRDFSPRAPWALVMGNEQKGLTDEQMAACEATISLPMRGRLSSLNLAVATGILLYQFTQ